MSRAELDQLYEYMIQFAKDPLAANGEFRPFAATLNREAQLRYYSALDAAENPDYRTQIQMLKQHLRNLDESEQIHAAGLCFDVVLHREGESAQDAIQCILENDGGEAIERFTPYSKGSDRSISYGQSTTADREREIFGLAGSVLTVENRAPIHSPTVKADLPSRRFADAARRSRIPASRWANQGYVQAAGGEEKLTAEWREYSDGKFTHWVAGLAEAAKEENAEIETSGCIVTVRKNEVLASPDVMSILAAFAQGKGRPPGYGWRDMTSHFFAGSS